MNYRSYGYVCLPLTLGAAITLIILSFSQLGVWEQGLDYNMILQTIDKTPYYSGRHFLGLGHKFIKFPSTYQTISFNDASEQLKSRTSDGLEVLLDLSFQYRLIHEKLYDIYMKFGNGFRDFYDLISRDVLTTVATEFTAYDFFTAPAKIRDRMEWIVNDAFQNESFARVTLFQLQSVNLPAEFDTAIQETEIRKQEIKTAMAEQGTTKIQMETKLLQSQREAIVMVKNAEGASKAVILQNTAQVQAFNTSQRWLVDAYSKLSTCLPPQNSETSLLEYMKLRAVRDHSGPVIAGIQPHLPAAK